MCFYHHICYDIALWRSSNSYVHALSQAEHDDTADVVGSWNSHEDDMKYDGGRVAGHKLTNTSFRSSFNILDFLGSVNDLRESGNGTESPVTDDKTTSDLAIYVPILIFCFPVIVMAVTCFMRLRINVLHQRQRKSLHRHNHSVSVSIPLMPENGMAANRRATAELQR